MRVRILLMLRMQCLINVNYYYLHYMIIDLYCQCYWLMQITSNLPLNSHLEAPSGSQTTIVIVPRLQQQPPTWSICILSLSTQSVFHLPARVKFMLLNQFPIASVKNFHEPSGLKQQKFILHFWRSEAPNQSPWAKIKIPTVLCFFWMLQGRSIYLAFSRFYQWSSITL